MLGGYAAFILPAYGLTALVTLGLIAWIWVVHRRLSRDIAELESRGVRRSGKRKAD